MVGFLPIVPGLVHTFVQPMQDIDNTTLIKSDYTKKSSKE